ncbi:MAG: aminotransferase class V-fold PLP-dependent enzyme [Pseudohongiellaceae bacterium]
MPGLLPHVDPDGLLEYSVVYTDRALNHMSQSFQSVMREISALLKDVYQADGVAIVPGSGTFGMEAVARQLATDRHVLVVRNGWFSYRWTQIFDMGRIPSSSTVLKARQAEDATTAPFSPWPIDEVVATIHAERPAVVFAPHVETSAGMLLPDDYIRAMAEAVHAVGGLLVIDCIASGTLWLDMRDLGIDVLISAPQKGWSSSPCAGLVMLSQRAVEQVRATVSTSFACDLGKWLQIMETYEKGGHAYHATMPTDGLRTFRDLMLENQQYGFARLRDQQRLLGQQVRALLESKGFASVAAPGFQAPGVVVSYTVDPEFQNGKKFMAQGLQIAAGVPLQVGERADFRSFRIGLFGIDKLRNVERSVAQLATVLEKLV